MSARLRPARILPLAAAFLCGLVLVFFAIMQITGRSASPIGPAIAGVGGPFHLEDQNGKPVSDRDFKGRPFLVFFGYTHCPDVCPTTLFELSEVMKSMGKDADRTNVLFVTVDPDRDTPAVMRRYVSLFDPAFVGLTGTEAQLDPVFDAYHVWHQRIPGTKASGYLMAHSGSVYLIDPAGELRVLHDWTDPAPAIASDVKELLG